MAKYPKNERFSNKIKRLWDCPFYCLYLFENHSVYQCPRNKFLPIYFIVWGISVSLSDMKPGANVIRTKYDNRYMVKKPILSGLRAAFGIFSNASLRIA